MPTYYDSQGNAHVLTEEIGRGGEGTVYFCQEDKHLVAKIYYEPISEEKAEKLRWMAANKNKHLLKVSAWVVDVLCDKSNGQVVGFLMPNVKAKEIHELYSLKSRRVYFPEATWHFLVHTATNVARAFYNLHKYEHVMGDVNHGNCVVLADGTVKLIDCDSYSIKTDKIRYACEVGVATHLAPELHGRNLRDVERRKKHDNFGLAVIIFQLLFLGRHPFAGNYLGAKDKTLEDCIREYRFAYGKNAKAKNVRQPPGTLSLSGVSPRIAKFFEKAFSENGERPNPREWIEALEDLSRNLEQCSLHPGHHFYEKLSSCPWCKIESQTGLMLFPFITSISNQDGEKPFNIFTVESLIAKFGISQNLPAKLIEPTKLPDLSPNPEVVEIQKDFHKHKFLVVGAQFISLIFLMAVFGVGASCFLGMLIMFACIAYLNNYEKSINEEIKDCFARASQKWEDLKLEWAKGAISPKLNDDLTQIRNKISDYKKIQQSSRRELKLLKEDNSRRQFDKYLRSHRLASKKIFGIKEAQRDELIKKGVRTAAEVEEKRLRYFHKVDDYLIKRLVEWREKLEKDFEPKKDSKLSEEDKKEFLQKTATKRRAVEKDIEVLLGSLRSGSLYLKKKQKELVAKSEKISNELQQANSDLRVLGNSSNAIIALVLITIFTPFFGIIAGGGLIPHPPRPAETYIYPGGDGAAKGSARDSGSGIVHTAPPPKPEYSIGVDIPRADITDEEIEELSDWKRNKYAENLYRMSTDLSSEADQISGKRSKYKDSEEKIRLAVRLKKNDIKYLNHLGYVLYQQEKYEESLKYLNQALETEKDNYGTKITIGINYLKMKRYKDARRLFSKIVTKNSTLEAQFNLGLAYKGLKDYSSAAKEFRKAVKINPDDADSHYELGYALYKKGDKDGAYVQHGILKKLDEGLAETLKKDANLFGAENRSSDPTLQQGDGMPKERRLN